jgi:hypothetical protein
MAQQTYGYQILRTVIPKDYPAQEEVRKLDERSRDLTTIGEDGYDLVSTFTLDQKDGVTVIVDTFKRPGL